MHHRKGAVIGTRVNAADKKFVALYSYFDVFMQAVNDSVRKTRVCLSILEIHSYTEYCIHRKILF